MSKWSGVVSVWMMCVLGVLLSSSSAFAQGRDVYVPGELEPWVDWVMASHTELQCSKIAAAFVCEWPGSLSLQVDHTEGRFELDVFTQRDGELVELPGGKRHWPQGVSVNGAPVVVMSGSDEQTPMVTLPKGKSRIAGRFQWATAPEVIKLPGDIARVDLTLLGNRVDWPRIDDSGQLFVKEASSKSVGEADTIRAAVYRHVADQIPMEITTLLELNVAGRAREVSLGQPLVPDARPVAVSGALPVQIGVNGEVKVYVRPGTYQVEIKSYLDRPVDQIKVPEKTQAFFDPVEYWVWTSDESLRSVELGGLLAIDPSRTTLPKKWQSKAAFVARPKEALTLNETRRGEPEQPPNQINLHRKLWLDLDGGGFTIKDSIHGTMHQDWRLNYMSEGGKLGRVVVTPEMESLLITKDVSKGDVLGVEVRDSELKLEAEIRLDDMASTEFLAVGWDHDVHKLDAELAMPPGWSVFAAQGVDEMSGTWVDSWDLFEFFVVLMIAFVMGKLFGWHWGVISALALVLSHGEVNAPRYVWFHIVAVLALLRVLPDKLWLKIPAWVYLGVSLIVLVSGYGSYAHQQIRSGLHPQITKVTSYNPSRSANFLDDSFVEEERSVQRLAKPMDVLSSADSIPKVDGEMLGGKRKGSWGAYQQIQQQIDPGEVVQTGPGLPNWSWNTWGMGWNGPVAKDQRIKLWLISPKLNLLFNVLSVLCFLLMGLVVFAPGIFAPGKKVSVDVFKLLKRLLVTSLVLVPVGMMSSFVVMPTQEVFAQGPSAEVLQELENRLVSADRCKGVCVSVPMMELELDEEGQLVMRAEVHAQRQAAWAIPGPANLLSLQSVVLDGGGQDVALRRDAKGLVYVRIPEGRHSLEVRGVLNVQNVLTLQLDPEHRPHQVKISAPAWGVDGIDEFGRPDASLQLSRQEVRKEESGDSGTEQASQELPPWYQVERTLLLGLPWQTRTVVTREDTERPQLVKIPLLEGEAIITDGVRVEGKEALVNFARGENRVVYISELSIPMAAGGSEAVFKLTAPEGKPWSEVWWLECSRIWSCEHEGLVPKKTVVNQIFQPIWYPWPGESLTIKVSKPTAAIGEKSTVTDVNYVIEPGKRRLMATLSMKVRASQGDWQRVTLPEGAELQSVMINQDKRSIRPEGNVVSLPITPGEQTFELKWIQPWERKVFEEFPAVDIGSEAVNVNMTMRLDSSRWLLWTVGPDWGPAVLFWSHMVLLVLLALLLGRLKQLPLKTYQWLLLVLGMSQMPLIAMIPVVAWFAMFVWRKEKPLEHAALFNLYQLFSIFWTLVAMAVLYAAVHSNLLFDVDMQVQGNGSYNTMLSWYVDRSASTLPGAGVLSLPLFVWRVAMFLWVLWIVSSLVKWLPWAWHALSDEQLWKPMSVSYNGNASSEGQEHVATPQSGASHTGGVETQPHAPQQEKPVAGVSELTQGVASQVSDEDGSVEGVEPEGSSGDDSNSQDR